MILEYIVTGNEMKLLDDTTSQVFLVPSVVLMEQAAAGVVRELVACFDKSKEFAVICGRGNNAGDGIAIARLLNQAGYRCMVYYAFGTDEAGSELFELQKNIYARYGFKVVSDIECVCKSDVIIDALFGTGLKRAIEGSLADVISAVNKANAYRVAVDVPSGVDSDKGHVMGCTFKADFTYTFSYKKTGLLAAAPEDVKNFLMDFQDTDRLKIMMAHRPDSFIFGDAASVWDVDLVVSGHDHGGQVVVPFAGGVFGGDQGYFPKYVHGMYEKDRLHLFVSSGLGSANEPLPRVNNLPEVAVVEIEKSTQT